MATVRTTFRAEEDLDRRLRIAAELDGSTVSALVRTAIEAHIKMIVARTTAAPEDTEAAEQEAYREPHNGRA